MARGTQQVLQTGGRTIKRGTAKALNELTGQSLSRREWGRSLEALKEANDLPNAHHGKILANGDYADDAGVVIDNIIDYLP